eukprot:m.1004045 g.1004045  ORF g.1004045 m.1004045 type:complete len:167 (+) comp24047_c0_seq1:3821-4321(+)
MRCLLLCVHFELHTEYTEHPTLFRGNVCVLLLQRLYETKLSTLKQWPHRDTSGAVCSHTLNKLYLNSTWHPLAFWRCSMVQIDRKSDELLAFGRNSHLTISDIPSNWAGCLCLLRWLLCLGALLQTEHVRVNARQHFTDAASDYSGAAWVDDELVHKQPHCRPDLT